MCPQQRLQSQNHVVTSDLLCPHWSFVCSELWPQALGDPSGTPQRPLLQIWGKREAEKPVRSEDRWRETARNAMSPCAMDEKTEEREVNNLIPHSEYLPESGSRAGPSV